MLMPTKVLKPENSIIYVSGFILNLISNREYIFDDLLADLNKVYSKNISLNKLLLSLNFLYLIGKVEIDDETNRIAIR